MTSKVKTFVHGFGHDERGTVAVVFGLMFMVLVLISGIAVDHGRMISQQQRIAAAADAAALAAGRGLLDGRLTDEEIKQQAIRIFNANFEEGTKHGVVRQVRVGVNRRTGEIKVDVDSDVPMTITRAGGFESFPVGAESATIFDQRDIELSMALDVTGSMAGSKLAALKDASKDLIDILLPAGGTQNKIRIGLAPYAASINAGDYARPVTNNISNRCVHERGGAQRFTDAAPGTGTWLGFTNGMSCPNARIEPLTTDAGLLKTRIDGFTASGMTAGHLGAAWAWYLVSPEWASLWPANSKPVSYSDDRTVKAIILMTDGVFNQSYVSGNGNSSQQARDLCEQMKGKNVVVYSVAFQAPSTAETLLRQCASSGDHYFNASDETTLRDAFKQIATNLNKLRLTQ
jgi:Flp pilus assembly protein TadG